MSPILPANLVDATPIAPHPALPHGVTRLDDWGVIRALGADAASFLHGQLTQDVQHLDEGHARLAGYCSVKGRLLASFVMWRRAPDEVLLACSADLLPAVLKRLSMFVLRAKCKLSDASADWPLWGLAGDAAAVAPAGALARAVVGGADLLRLPDAVVDGHAVPRALWAGAEAPAGTPLAAEAWRWLEVHSGVARITAATSEQFVPQMVNLELVGGVNFQKGCYPGQEIVARSQYRGTLKRRGHIVEAAVALQPAQEVFHSADPGQPAGMVVLAGQWEGRQAALVELKLAALEGGSLHAGSADGPLLTPTPLPYAIPADAA
ncbi:MAG: folate-binding protein [Rubrivivax sp.]|nr:folate-binding protein [Rubrivivax sp.]